MKTLFILFLCTSVYSFAQPEKQDVKFKRFAIGVNASPDFNYRTLHNIEKKPEQDWNKHKDQMNQMFAPRLGFSAGGHVLYYLTRDMYIETGAQYSFKGYQRRPALGVMFMGGNPEPAFIGDMKDHYNFNFLDVPLTMNYVILKDKRLQLVASIGLVWNHMRHSSIKHFNRETVNNQFVPVLIFHTPYRDNTFSGTVGFGIQYQVNDWVFLRAVPTFRHSFIPIETNLAESAYYWNAGLNVSCSFKLF